MLITTEVVMSLPRPFISHRFQFVSRRFSLVGLLLALALTALPLIHAQSQPQAPPAQPQQPDQATPDAGGPGGDSGSIALPKKKEPSEDDTPPPAPAAPKLKTPEGGTGNFSLRVDVPEVNVDVGVLLEKTGQFVPGLKPSNFRVYEDGVEQKVLGFKRVEAPITALMICEFAATNYYFIYDMRNAAFAFASQLRPQDYVALMTFDLRTQIQLDFTQDKNQFAQAINSLLVPGFSETDVFDALYEGMDRLNRIPGHKYIILIASGIDTLSKLTLDQILKAVKASQDITIFTVSTGGFLRAASVGGYSLTFLQADNQMKTFAKYTGGVAYFPRFEAEMPEIFQEINQNIRSKYQLVYHPTNAKQDGTYRKLRVELVDDEGKPLRMQDEKHRPLKYDIIARDGYRAKPEVE